MPPKAVKKLPWAKCDSCGVDIPQNEIKAHLDSACDLEKTAYISKEIFSGQLEFSCADSKVYPPKLIHQLVFINPSTATLCKLVIGEPVLIQSSDSKSIVRLMWPSKCSVCSIVLPTDGLDPEWQSIKCRKASVKKLDIVPIEATEIILKCKDSAVHNIDNNELLLLVKEHYDESYVCKESSISFCYFGKAIKFKIATIKPEDENGETWFKLSSNTQWIFPKKSSISRPKITLGGVDMIIDEVKKYIKMVLQPRNNANIKSIQPVSGVLLYGHSGAGKTAICKYLIQTLPYYSVSITGPEVFSKFFGETEKTLKNLFDEAMSNQPSIIFVDEVDTICPKRVGSASEQEKRILSAFVSLIDGLHENENEVFLLCTTNKPDMIDPVLRRFGRLDKEIEVPVPSVVTRNEILCQMLCNTQHNLSQADIEEIGQLAHGFVPADLMHLCSDAIMNAISRCVEDEIVLSREDFSSSLSTIKPSAMREVLLEVPNVKWSDIGGMDDLKLKLKQAVEWPIKHADRFTKLGIKPPSGVLMYGPPGCSKTMIAKALATESSLNFLSIKGPELFSKWVGESEKAVRQLFHRARQVAPAIIFFDEIDALGGERSQDGASSSVHERVLTQILTEIDGIVPLNNVTIVAATNRPDCIDRALLRPGRIDRIVYVPLPDHKTRTEIFKLKLGSMSVSDDVEIAHLVSKTDGFSGAEIQAICHEAAMKALEEDIESEAVHLRHFDDALMNFNPRTPQYLLDIYEKFSLNTS